MPRPHLWTSRNHSNLLLLATHTSSSKQGEHIHTATAYNEIDSLLEASQGQLLKIEIYHDTHALKLLCFIIRSGQLLSTGRNGRYQTGHLTDNGRPVTGFKPILSSWTQITIHVNMFIYVCVYNSKLYTIHLECFVLDASLNICHAGPSCCFFPVAMRYSSSSDRCFFFRDDSRNSWTFLRWSAIMSGILAIFSAILALLQD